MKEFLAAILKQYKMERSDLYNDDRIIEIVKGELQNYKNSRELGECLDNLFYVLKERADIQEEQ